MTMSNDQGMPKRNSYPLRWKLLLAVGSLLASLALLEVGLWATGQLLLDREAPILQAEEGRESPTRILCVGDSYTWGDSGAGYPAELKKLLDARYGQGRFQVVNHGLCERNSTQLLKELPRMLATYRPDLVIMLLGDRKSVV